MSVTPLTVREEISQEPNSPMSASTSSGSSVHLEQELKMKAAAKAAANTLLLTKCKLIFFTGDFKFHIPRFRNPLHVSTDKGKSLPWDA